MTWMRSGGVLLEGRKSLFSHILIRHSKCVEETVDATNNFLCFYIWRFAKVCILSEGIKLLASVFVDLATAESYRLAPSFPAKGSKRVSFLETATVMHLFWKYIFRDLLSVRKIIAVNLTRNLREIPYSIRRIRNV